MDTLFKLGTFLFIVFVLLSILALCNTSGLSVLDILDGIVSFITTLVNAGSSL
jgi:hypothetical protein